MDKSLTYTDLFFNNADFERRLRQGIIRYKGEPYQVTATGDTQMVLNILSGEFMGQGMTVSYDNKHVDLDPVPLGFVNKATLQYYLRKPIRLTRQLTHTQNTLIYNMIDDSWMFEGQNSSNNIFYNLEFVDCVKGNYPSIEAIQAKMLSSKKASKYGIAFHRHFAIIHRMNKETREKTYDLYFKITKIGEIDLLNMELKLQPAFNNCTNSRILRDEGLLIAS